MSEEKAAEEFEKRYILINDYNFKKENKIFCKIYGNNINNRQHLLRKYKVISHLVITVLSN
jgi:hypothetical protein